MPIQLTSLSNARLYLYQVGDQVTSDDTLLTLLINQISGAILSDLQRPGIFKTTFTETRDGVGNAVMTLRNYPVLSVSSVTVAAQGRGGYPWNYAQSFVGGTQVIPQATQFGYTGYSFDPWDGTAAGNPSKLTLNGYTYWRGQNNVQIVYQAGYSVTNEPYTVVSSTSSGLDKYTALQPYGSWGQDDGVYYSSGSSLTALTSGNQPSSAGQYLVTNGVYQFNVADAGQVLNINYSYVPTDLEQACIQWVAERYSYRSRIGQKSKTLASQETASYDLTAIPAFVDVLINKFRRWLPV
jgi:hypothetical protein